MNKKFLLPFLIVLSLCIQVFAQGTMIYETVHIPSLEGNFLGDSPDREVNIYLPPGYTENQNYAYPVIYLLHGFLGTHDYWLQLSPDLYHDIQSSLDNLYVRGEIQPMIVVMPNSYNKWHGSWYVNSIATGNWEDYIVEDLVEYMDTNYRTLPHKDSRGIGGYSMGGTGSFKLAMKHPDIYSAIFSISAGAISFEHSTLSPAYKDYLIQAANETDASEFDQWYWRKQVMVASAAAFAPDTTSPPFYGIFPVDEEGVLIDSIWSKWLEHDPYTIYGSYIENLQQLDSIWIECGTLDDLYDSNLILYLALDSAGLTNAIWDEYDGNHGTHTGQRVEEKLLPYFSEILDGDFSKSTAMARSMQYLFPAFINKEGDSLIINTTLHNPEGHPVNVYAMITGEQSASTDSIPLYDDGQHEDSLTNDNIWGNARWVSDLKEDIFNITINTYDEMEEYKSNLLPVRAFTTIGPIQYIDWIPYLLDDSVANPGDVLSFKILLKNEGETAQANIVEARLTSTDDRITIVNHSSNYNDIAAGTTMESHRGYSLIISEDFHRDTVIYLPLEILSNGTHFWTDSVRLDVVTSIDICQNFVPLTFSLEQNYPNPFNPRTMINYQLPVTSSIDLSIYNLAGQKVATLVSENQNAGHHQVEWDASEFASGVYYYRLSTSSGFVQTRKLVLIK